MKQYQEANKKSRMNRNRKSIQTMNRNLHPKLNRYLKVSQKKNQIHNWNLNSQQNDNIRILNGKRIKNESEINSVTGSGSKSENGS